MHANGEVFSARSRSMGIKAQRDVPAARVASDRHHQPHRHAAQPYCYVRIHSLVVDSLGYCRGYRPVVLASAV